MSKSSSQTNSDTNAENLLSLVTAPPLLSVNDLEISFDLKSGLFKAVSNLSFDLTKGKTLGLVGESGSGKSLSALALLRLLPKPGKITTGQILFNGQNIIELPEENMRNLRGRKISMIFQEPMTALNPVLSIGDQVAETLLIHGMASSADANKQAVMMLDRVGIADASQRAKDYPHNLSGGMRQRAMIAMALICKPEILIADEATTALDTTIQAQILDLLMDLQAEFGMAILFISHNLSVVSEIADDVMVMYGGRLMEISTSDQLFEAPKHPYTKGLLATLPRPETRGRPLNTIEGNVPDRYDQLIGCRFAPRCRDVMPECHLENIPVFDLPEDRRVSCLKYADE